MKRINLILLSEGDDAPVVDDNTAIAEYSSSMAALESTLIQFPGMKDDPAIKALIELDKNIPAPVEGAPEVKPEVKLDAEGKPISAAKVEDANVLNVPFFKSADGEKNFDKVKIEELPTVAKEIGIDTSKEGWIGEILKNAQSSAELTTKLTEAETNFKQLNDDLNTLPKEVQEIIKVALEDGDWRSVLGGASVIDYSTDFGKLKAEDKIKIHNYLFPEDILPADSDITDKAIAKSLKAAESKFNSEKEVVKLKSDQATVKAKDEGVRYAASVEASFNSFKKEYPEFSSNELKRVENIIKKEGIASIFFDKQGNALPDAVEKLAFALTGKQVLNAAVAIAKNKGKSEGKSEILQTVETRGTGARNENGRKLTDEENNVERILKDSYVDSSLTY